MARESWNWLVNDNVEESLTRLAASHARGRLLDIGCGMMPYRHLLAPYVSEHIGVDHVDSPHALPEGATRCSAYAIDFPDASFDTAICTFVLEHLEEPALALAECSRVLRDGGVAIYQVPFIWHPHEEPRDFYRFSAHGLRHLFERAGFEVVAIEALSGFWLTFGQLFVYYMLRHDRGVLRRLRIIRAASWVTQHLARRFDRWDRAEEWTHGYAVVARKRMACPVSAEARA